MATRKAATTAKRPAAKSAASRAKKTTTVKAKTTPKSVPATRTTVTRTDLRTHRAGYASHFDEKRGLRFGAALIAEFIGTFMLVAVALHPSAASSPLFVLFVLVAIVLLFGSISGAFVNPAFVIAGLATRRLSLVRALGYLVVQILGALLAYAVLALFVGQQAPVDPQAAASFTQQANFEMPKAVALTEGKEWFILLAEMIATFVFALGVASVARRRVGATAKAFVVGAGFLTAAIVGSFLGQMVGATTFLNPVIAGAHEALNWSVWPIAIYALGTSLAAVLAFVVYDVLYRASHD